jgi:hypothetical protein
LVVVDCRNSSIEAKMRACQSSLRSLPLRGLPKWWIALLHRKRLRSVEHDLGRQYGSECEGIWKTGGAE